MALIHNWEDIEARGKDWLTPAERKLIAACKAGEPCELGNGKLPPDGPASPEREIRADLLRYLILGGCDKHPVRGGGVRLIGGHVTGDLDLGFARARGATGLNFCRFEKPISALHTRFEFLNLTNSVFPALNAQGARVTGSVFLNNTTATGEVRLAEAKIGGQLNCEKAKFSASKKDGYALTAQGLRVREALIWRKLKKPKGRIRFASAHVGDLVDDAASWPGGERLFLDGFTYDRISGAVTDAGARIAWLEKGCYRKGEFFPQPFTHLAKVLRAMGHDGDARAVLLHRERLIRQNIRARSRDAPAGAILRLCRKAVINPARWLWDVVQRAVIGYGHYPFRSLFAMAVLIALAGGFAYFAYDEGSFAPNSGPILVSQDWKDFADLPGNPAALWSAKGAPGQDWESFNFLAYGADLVIPIVEFGQTDAWAPSTTREWWGAQLWWARWVFTLMGWVVTALGAAALTGLIRRD